MNARMFRARRTPLSLAAALALAGLLAGCGGRDDGDDTALEIRTLSTRADLVTGGDALVEIATPGDASGLRVTLNGTDVTGAFARSADGRLIGHVTGLASGSNTLVASTDDADERQLTLTNRPRSGPVISGKAVTPFHCAQPTPQPASGLVPGLPASGLSGAPDADCSIPTETQLYYRTTTAGCTFGLPDPVWSIGVNATTVPAQPVAAATACFKPFDPAAPRPADVAQTTTDAGQTVDYIVRVERGTMNRGIYDIVTLFDPTTAWSATAPQAHWNGKVYFSFGASTGQPRRQVRPATAWPTLDVQIGRGYVVAMNSMTDSARNSNRVAMAETTMMMKEHIGDTYGPIAFTIGAGCSGGSINSNMNASIMPGLLDGVITSCTYPDSETTGLEVADCVVLVEAYQRPEMGALWAGLTQDQINARKGAINGHPDQTACHAWYNAFGSNGRAGLYFPRLVSDNATGAITQQPAATNNCELPNAAVYDPANPVATADLPRCNAWNWGSSIWGTVPGSAAARDTRDNVGVQYGLKALIDGAITAEEFVTLNEVVGGVDRDSTPRAERTTADAEALDIAYRSGIVMSGRQVAKTAIIDLRGWDDSNLPQNMPPGLAPSPIPIHHQWYSFAIRDRLVAESESGDAGNQALWRFARTGLAAPGTLGVEALDSMDQWLTALKADTSGNPLEQKVRAARPASTADFCIPPEDPTQTTRITDMAVCDANRFLQPSLSPRQVAGGPRAENVLKCELKPIDAADYAPVSFSAGQLARLQAVFPEGVCDWSQPGVGQTLAVSPLTFAAGPGGQPLPEAPQSTPR